MPKKENPGQNPENSEWPREVKGVQSPKSVEKVRFKKVANRRSRWRSCRGWRVERGESADYYWEEGKTTQAKQQKANDI